MTDIVERLLAGAGGCKHWMELHEEAAAEILRLRALASSGEPLHDEADDWCDVPPFGWRCTRAKGHEGPCAAVPAPDDIEFVAKGMERLREGGA